MCWVHWRKDYLSTISCQLAIFSFSYTTGRHFNHKYMVIFLIVRNYGKLFPKFLLLGTSTVIEKVGFCHIFYFLLEQLLEYVVTVDNFIFFLNLRTKFNTFLVENQRLQNVEMTLIEWQSIICEQDTPDKHLKETQRVSLFRLKMSSACSNYVKKEKFMMFENFWRNEILLWYESGKSSQVHRK